VVIFKNSISRILVLTVLILFFFPLSANASQGGAIEIFVNGGRVNTDVAPFIDSNNRTLVPLRFVAESLGAAVHWNGNEKKVTIVQNSHHIELVVGMTSAKLNGHVFQMDTSPVIKGGRVMVPLRFVSERLGCQVAWNAQQKAVFITKNDSRVNPGEQQDRDLPVRVRYGYVTGSTVNVRSGPGIDHRVIDQVSEGTRLQIIGERDGWYQVKTFSDRVGWIAGWLVAVEGEESDSRQGHGESFESSIRRVAIVAADTANIRGGPSTTYPLVGQSYRGEELLVMEEQGKWFKVSKRGLPEGWIANWLVALKEEPVIERGKVLSSRGSGIINKIKGLECESSGRTAEVVIKAAREISYTSQFLSNPERLVVDISGARVDYSEIDDPREFDVGPVERVRIGQFEKDVVRFVFDLRYPCGATFDLRKSGSELEVKIYPTPLRGRVVVLDLGHGSIQSGGWSDPGAIGPSGLSERDVIPQIAKRAGELLSSKGATVIYTRVGDTVMNLSQRADLANSYEADVFVSIHCNASLSPLLSGISTYYYALPSMTPSMRAERKRLATLIQEELLKALGRKNLGIREEGFSVLRNTWMPSVLAEIAFISNEEEERLLADSDFCSKAGEAIAAGITRYFESH